MTKAQTAETTPLGVIAAGILGLSGVALFHFSNKAVLTLPIEASEAKGILAVLGTIGLLAVLLSAFLLRPR